MDKQIVLFGHGGSYNHGCEAIVRSTVKLLKNNIDNINLYSNSVPSDKEFGLDKIVSLHEQRNPFHITNFGDDWAMIAQKFLHNDNLYLKRFFTGKMDNVKNSVCISIGGDMYCYGRLPWIYYIHKLLQKNLNKTVLWGCSVNEDSFFPEAKEDLKRYDLIIARENISYNLFQKHGFHNVKLYPDSAFILDPQKTILPFEFDGNNTIAINLSPLMTRYKGQSLLEENTNRLINHILNNSNMNILFVPHVNGHAAQEDDYSYMKKIADRYQNSRIQIVPKKYNCKQLKYIIGQCHFLITARTHASIAAYSSFVPTLVLGYSIKSRGIAQDIFNDDKHYVIPIQLLKNKNELVDAFEWLKKNEVRIKNHLHNVIPDYIQKVYGAEDEIKQLMEKNHDSAR